MRAGPRRHLVLIQRPETDPPQDTAGQVVADWVTVTPAMASIEQLSARERFVSAQEFATATHRVCLYYQVELDGIDANWRVLFGDRVFTLVAPPNNVKERNREIELLCEEGPPS